MSSFLTGTGKDRSNGYKPKGKRSITHKEDVARALTEHHNIPPQVAEVAVIDLRYLVTLGYHNKLSPRETAYTMVERINHIYNPEGKKW